MTVKQLIKKLSKLPEDTEVLIPNRNLYRDGEYVVTEVDDYSCMDGTVLLDTDYERWV
ncbi:MAG: hypothetical protein K6E54_00705 [Bacteroidaceae bacterium]|nr:hypothetical protein [Bacteroidaceae bacterium]